MSATTIHLSPSLLASVDRRASELGLSRSRYIARTLERSIEKESNWSPAFMAELRAARDDGESREAMAEMLAAIKAHRNSKAPPDL